MSKVLPAFFLRLLPLWVAAAILAARWHALPQRYPAHWNAAGQANRWVDKTPHAVFGPLLTGALLCVFIGFCGWRLERRSGNVPARSAVVRLLIAAQVFVALVFGLIAVAPLLSPAASARLFPALLVLTGAFVVVLVILGAGAARKS